MWSFRNLVFSTLSSTPSKKDSGSESNWASFRSKSFESLLLFQTISYIYSSCWKSPKIDSSFLEGCEVAVISVVPCRRKEMLLLLCHKNNCSFPRSFSKDPWAHLTQLNWFFGLSFVCLFLFFNLKTKLSSKYFSKVYMDVFSLHFLLETYMRQLWKSWSNDKKKGILGKKCIRFLCYLTNSLKCISIKQHALISSVPVGQQCTHNQLDPLQSCCWPGLGSHLKGLAEEGSTSTFTEIVVRIQFLVAIGPRAQTSCRLQLLETTLGPLSCGPPNMATYFCKASRERISSKTESYIM